MTDQPITQPEDVTPPRQPSRIVITFSDVNSTLLDIQYSNVAPLQVMAAGWVLTKSAEEAINKITQQQNQQQQQPKIAVPTGYERMIPK